MATYEDELKETWRNNSRDPQIYQLDVVHKEGLCTCCFSSTKFEHKPGKEFTFKHKWKSRRNSAAAAKEVKQK